MVVCMPYIWKDRMYSTSLVQSSSVSAGWKVPSLRGEFVVFLDAHHARRLCRSCSMLLDADAAAESVVMKGTRYS